MGIFVSSYQYVIDSYETNSANALSIITFLRYFVAGGMVVAARPMYEGIGVHWVMTIMGSAACSGPIFILEIWRQNQKEEWVYEEV